MGYSITWKEYLHLRLRGEDPWVWTIDAFIKDASILIETIQKVTGLLEAARASAAEGAAAFERLNEAW